MVIQLPKLTFIIVIIGEPKYKYGQQEQATVRNHNRSTALERSVLKYGGWGGLGCLNRFYGIPTSPLGSAVLHYKCNIKHITHNNKGYEVCIYYNPPPIKFVTLINKMNLIKFVSKIINGKGNIFIVYVIFSIIVLDYQQTAFN